MKSCQSVDSVRHHLAALVQGCAIGHGGIQCSIENGPWCATVHVADPLVHIDVGICRSSTSQVK